MYFFSIIKIIFINYLKYLFFYENTNILFINILKDLGKLNIIFIKIFQWLIYDNRIQQNIISKDISDFLITYTNNCPYNDNNIDYNSLYQCYTFAYQNNYTFTIDSLTPINTGSIALVFKGNLNGNKIVIKILRKNIENEINNAIKFISQLIFLLSYFKNCDKIIKILKENIFNFKNQIDFKKESININLFQDLCKYYNFIIIPKTYTLFNDNFNNLIIMDYIDGYHPNQIFNEDKEKFFKYFIKSIKNTVFIKNIFHMDLHPGNIILVKKNNTYKIGLIDFGMIKQLSINEINFFYVFIDLIFNNNYKDFFYFLEDNINEVFLNYDIEKINKLLLKLRFENENNNFLKKILLKDIILILKLLLQYFDDFHLIINNNIYEMLLGICPLISSIIAISINDLNKGCHIVSSQFKINF